MTGSRPTVAIPRGVTPGRRKLLEVALAEVGTREATGRNDGPVEKYVPDWARGKGLPWCAWFGEWCWHQAFGRWLYGGAIGSVSRLVREARARGHVIDPTQPAPSRQPQPGDFVFLLYDGDGGPGHLAMVLACTAGDEFVAIEGNRLNAVRLTVRRFSEVDGAIVPWLTIADLECDAELLASVPAWLPVVRHSLDGTR